MKKRVSFRCYPVDYKKCPECGKDTKDISLMLKLKICEDKECFSIRKEEKDA